MTKGVVPYASGLVHRFGMYPQETFAGHAEARVLADGTVEYQLFFVPFDGQTRTLIVDPANEEEMRAVRQLHLRPEVCG